MQSSDGEEKPKTEETPPAAADAAPAATSSDDAPPTQGSLDANDASNKAASADDSSDTPQKVSPIKKIYKKVDVYFLAFVFIVLIAIVVSYIALQKNKSATPVSVATQTLDQNALKQINSNDTSVGGTNQTLDIQSATVFNGNVLVKQGLQVAGSLKVAGSLSLPGITVSGTTDLGQVNANTLSLTGAETVKGQLTVDQGITVNGIANFSGALNAAAITVTSLEVNGDITFEHHIYTTGSIPKDTSTSSLGAGGTSSVNGTDTAGNVSVNTGANPAAGCMVIITFAKSYATTPFIEITPVGQASGGNIGLYITRSFGSFSICMNSPTADSPMSFDYQVLG